MTNPKLALIPSGYKSGKVYSILPNDGTQDFSLDRDTVGTRVRKDGLIEEVVADTPRLDYKNSDCPTMLRECQRTNLVTYSEDFSQSDWSKTNISITTNSSISPDGTINASLLTENSSNAQHFIGDALTLTSGTSYSVSVYAKKKERSVLQISPSSSHIASSYANYDLDLGVVSATGGSVTAEIEYLSNDWYRCILKFTVTSTATATLAFFIQTSTTALRGATYQGNGTSGIYLWGAQAEAEVGSTSYIKTEGTIQTRDLDNLECTTTYTVGNDATWFLDFDAFTFDNSFRALMVIRNSGFTQSMDLISYKSGSDYYIRIRATNQSALQTIIAFGEDAIQMFTRNKVAIRLYGSNFEIYVNGTREYTGTSDDGDWTLLNNSTLLNDFGSTTEAPSLRLYDFRVYDQTMTQSELEELTT
mgnify:CR=1 FL=1